MKRKIFRGLVAVIFCGAVIYACTKETTSSTNTQSVNSTQQSEASISPDVQAFASHYGFTVAATDPGYTNTFSDTGSAGIYVRSIQAQIQNNTVEPPLPLSQGGTLQGETLQGEMQPNNPNPDCSQTGWYGGQLTGLGGLFSSFNLSFRLNFGGSLSNVGIWVSGMPVFWTWSAIGTSTGINTACVWGTVNWGISVRGIPLSVRQDMQFNIRKVGCNVIVTAGANACFGAI